MAKRGRPRHPDILTPREWEVLALLREGLTNEQIAERMGVAERTARFHVSEILGKLGVSTRQEAASWEPEERRAWWAMVLPWLSIKKGWVTAAFVATVVFIGAAAAGTIAWWIVRTHSEDHVSVAALPPRTSTPRACPTPGGGAIVDYVDFLKFQGILYVSQRYENVVSLNPAAKLGQVECKIADIVGDPSYQAQDRDSAYLPPGTAIYAIEGYDTRFRLAVRSPVDGALTVYEASTNPQARTGRDLLDIAGKVQYVSVNSETDGVTELAAIRQPEQVAALVSLVLAAPVDHGPTRSEGERYFIAFHLLDGTEVNRSYWLTSGELYSGIILPSAFGEAIISALAEPHS